MITAIVGENFVAPNMYFSLFIVVCIASFHPPCFKQLLCPKKAVEEKNCLFETAEEVKTLPVVSCSLYRY